ncbi:hypothetical protein F5B22DRAFT_610279 [Xylaria bambusicola]|uniref:uncharacterized protein n=1 Tax=Xylaria bambusicola TaxID=326684 RepID=UPI002007B2AE|nr:uncharacterized protein F5B22DRAFT_610279 [Xylaria bambusicola]KAI0514661.1 hypothetical protein F5B22DRAFT_610279 [Xylaria bambusicola]
MPSGKSRLKEFKEIAKRLVARPRTPAAQTPGQSAEPSGAIGQLREPLIDNDPSIEDPVLGTGAHPTISDTEPEIDVKVTNGVGDDRSPIWCRSMQRFAKERPDLYEIMKDRIALFGKLQSIDDWETWLNNCRNFPDHKRFRQVKAYLPSFKAVRSIATTLSNLDPHGIARLIIPGVFLAVELCLETVNPETRDQAMSMMLKVKVLIDKWIDGEADLEGLSRQFSKGDQNLEKIREIEKKLGYLYFDCLRLISEIYKCGMTRCGRAGATLVSGSLEWNLAYQNLDRTNTQCSDWKNQAELAVKRNDANKAILDEIRDRSKDLEPEHQFIKEKVGIHASSSTAGDWFLKTKEFNSWLGAISHGEATNRAFWLKGSMGTGKTTLMCRILSHFEERPISGVKFVPYYCYASGISQESTGPTHETIIRALCRRLAWNSDGSVADPAKDLFQNRNHVDTSFTVLSTWEPLLKTLIASSKVKIVLVLDALDECKECDTFLRFIEGLSMPPNGPYFIISSRPHVEVKKYSKDAIEFNPVNPDADQDMKDFIREQIESKNNSTWGNSIFFGSGGSVYRNRLEEALHKTADGMFRWVEIWLGIFFPVNQKPIRQPGYAQKLLAELENPKTLTELAKRQGIDNNNLADTSKYRLGEAYRTLWNIAGGEQYGDLQTSVFQIVLGAFRALTPSELLEAVCLANPDASFELDELKGVYCNFLKVNNSGGLDFEHLSARIFVSELKKEGSVDLMFCERECRHMLTDIVIKAIEKHKHPIWSCHQIDLIDWGSCARGMLRSKYVEDPVKVGWRRMVATGLDSAHFGQYVLDMWTLHCSIGQIQGPSMERFISLCQNAEPSLEGLLLTTTCRETKSWFRRANFVDNAVLPLFRQDGRENTVFSPFLLMISLGLSPFMRGPESVPTLLPGFDIDDITISNYKGLTALHIACQAKHTKIIKDLLELMWAMWAQTIKGFCAHILELRDHKGKHPMHYACTDDLVKLFLEYEFKGKPNQTLENGRLVSSFLYSKDKRNTNIIADVVEGCSDDFLERMFARYTPGRIRSLDRGLWPAFRLRKEKTIHSLQKQGADVEYAMLELSMERYIEVENLPSLEYMYDKLAEYDFWPLFRQFALSLAAGQGSIPVAQLLLNRGAIIDACGDVYDTALTEAAAFGRIDMVTFLLDQGAEINAIGCDLGNVLAVAAYQGYYKMVQVLLDRQADINATGGRYGNALAAAVVSDETRIAELLLDRGADINANSGKLGRPLGACLKGLTGFHGAEMMKLLLSKGADIDYLKEEDQEEVRYILYQQPL